MRINIICTLIPSLIPPLKGNFPHVTFVTFRMDGLALQNVTTTTMASTETTTANPPPPSSSGYSLTYTHSTENGTVVVANDNDDNNNNSSIAKSRKKGDLEEEPVEDLPSLPDPPLHSEEADDTSTTRDWSTLSRTPICHLSSVIGYTEWGWCSETLAVMTLIWM